MNSPLSLETVYKFYFCDIKNVLTLVSFKPVVPSFSLFSLHSIVHIQILLIVGRSYINVAELLRESSPSSFGGGKAGFWEEFESLQQQECKYLYSRVKVGHGQVLLGARI